MKVERGEERKKTCDCFSREHRRNPESGYMAFGSAFLAAMEA